MDESEDEEVLLFVLLLGRRRRRLRALNRQTWTKRLLMRRQGQACGYFRKGTFPFLAVSEFGRADIIWTSILRPKVDFVYFHYYACAVQTNTQTDSFRSPHTGRFWHARRKLLNMLDIWRTWHE